MSEIKLPDMCNTHQALLVKQLDYSRWDSWQALLIATQIALFQGATCDPNVYQKLGGKVENMHRLGCLACCKPDLFGTLIQTAQNHVKDDRIKAIKELGERWVRESTGKESGS